MHGHGRWLLLLLALAAVPAVDLVLPPAWQIAGAFPRIMVIAIAALGLVVITGWCGMLHLGTAAFMAVGAYVYAILSAPSYPFQIGAWPALAAALVAGGCTGVLLGLPTLRLRGDYLALVTLGFGEIATDVLRNLEPVTKGAQGIVGLPVPAPGWTYWAYLLVLVVAVVGVEALRRTGLGRAWVALRDDEIAARSMGLAPGPLLLAALAVAGALGALAGGLWAGLFASSNEPGSYDFSLSVLVLCAIIVGGLGSPRGAVLGAILMAGVSTVVIDRLAAAAGGGAGGHVLAQPANWKYLLFGLALVLMARLRPAGICAEPGR
jgi:branched-chain amino acid transport system permease protein